MAGKLSEYACLYAAELPPGNLVTQGQIFSNSSFWKQPKQSARDAPDFSIIVSGTCWRVSSKGSKLVAFGGHSTGGSPAGLIYRLHREQVRSRKQMGQIPGGTPSGVALAMSSPTTWPHARATAVGGRWPIMWPLSRIVAAIVRLGSSGCLSRPIPNPVQTRIVPGDDPPDSRSTGCSTFVAFDQLMVSEGILIGGVLPTIFPLPTTEVMRKCLV